MILRLASALYAGAAGWRREWYAGHPDRRKRLTRPVVSVGNLSVGGSGKTPTVAAVARLLLSRGERPAILSRGYRRRHRERGVTVVSDGARVLADVARAGDEPLMLARMLDGVSVLVGADRHRSGRVAEDELGATVHILDDGFQHLPLARDVELLLVDEADLADAPLPAGRLRESPGTAQVADAILTFATDPDVQARLRRLCPDGRFFTMRRTLGAPRPVGGGGPAPVEAGTPAFVLTGVARPARFVGDAVAAGWPVVGSMSFGDHHWFTDADLARAMAAAQAAGAGVVLTTAKDAVRLEGRVPSGVPVAVLPMTVVIEPAAAFADWLGDRLDAARSRFHSDAGGTS